MATHGTECNGVLSLLKGNRQGIGLANVTGLRPGGQEIPCRRITAAGAGADIKSVVEAT